MAKKRDGMLGRMISLFVSLHILIAPAGCGQERGPQYYAIDTPLGRMVVRLHDETPQHRDNFADLVSEAFYDSTTFHRVIEGFMIQGGDPNSRDEHLRDDGQGGPGYTLPAEIWPGGFHKRGAVAAARLGDEINPEMESNGSQFYVVQAGEPIPPAFLDQLEEQVRERRSDSDFAFSQSARDAYTTIGGTPHLDGAYTVFGEVVQGLDVLDAIAELPTLRKRWAQDDPALEGRELDPALIDQPPQRIWMTVKPLPGYEPEQ